ncbi:MAG: GNAT family N-acetyltransferase [Anaerolineae bacterium]|nr:GNAT family N-acetyltransferase [Anaerolineae bacterium]
METYCRELKGGRQLIVREAAPEDARALLAYIETVSGESNFLTFGPGEFELDETQEANVLQRFRETPNQIYLIGKIGVDIVSSLSFSGGKRARTRHCGAVGLSVRQAYWGLGVGSAMLDALIAWAQNTGLVTKIDLQVRTDNHRAIALYLRKGFSVEGTLRKTIALGGRYFDTYYMGLDLEDVADLNQR